MEGLEGLPKQLEQMAARVIEREEAAQETQVESQKAEGRANLIPFPRISTEPFRSELTIERHAIFVSNSYKGDSWQFERTIKHPQTGELVVQKVMVGKVDEGDRPRGVLTQAHQEIFYRLLKLWDERGYKLEDAEGAKCGSIRLSGYDLVTALTGDDSRHSYSRVRRLLRDLQGIPIVVKNASTRKGIQNLREFTLLAEVDWNIREIDKETKRPLPGKSEVMIAFSSFVTDGFLRKNVKQLLLGSYMQLGRGKRGRRAEIARLLYPILDHELASKDEYHCRLVPLAERLGLAPKQYKSDRRRQFEQSLRCLNGVPILGEKFQLRVDLRDTEDGRDCVLTAQRQPNQAAPFQSR